MLYALSAMRFLNYEYPHLRNCKQRYICPRCSRFYSCLWGKPTTQFCSWRIICFSWFSHLEFGQRFQIILSIGHPYLTGHLSIFGSIDIPSRSYTAKRDGDFRDHRLLCRRINYIGRFTVAGDRGIQRIYRSVLCPAFFY